MRLLAKIAGGSVPQDRPIDGVDQTEFLLGKSDKSKREGFPVFVADRLEAVQWRNWKVVFYDEQRDWWSPPTKLGTPKAFNPITDPRGQAMILCGSPRVRWPALKQHTSRPGATAVGAGTVVVQPWSA